MNIHIWIYYVYPYMDETTYVHTWSLTFHLDGGCIHICIHICIFIYLYRYMYMILIYIYIYLYEDI